MFNRNDIQPDLIIDKLYLGCMMCAESLETLKKLDISHILIVSKYIEPKFPSVRIKLHIIFLIKKLQLMILNQKILKYTLKRHIIL